MNIKNMLARFKSLDISSIKDSKLQAKAKKLKAKQGGFTLLELLVVVAILAAIAGTATIALQDTDARASAAAHVAIMDEMNKGIRTYRVLNGNQYPNNFDSLIQVDADDLSGPTLMDILAIEDLDVGALTVDQFARLAEVGIDSFAYVSEAQDPAGEGDCDAATVATAIEDLVGSRQNAVVAGNVFLSANGNGCGVRAVFDGDTAGDGSDVPGYNVISQAAPVAGVVQDPAVSADVIAGNIPVALWNGGAERVTGQAELGAYNADGNTAFMAVGLGPASSLFNANELGGMTSVPAYRHVSGTEYNRFIAIWDIGEYDAAGDNGIIVTDQPNLTTIVDGAGDTKDEELGEWDGTRNTI